MENRKTKIDKAEDQKIENLQVVLGATGALGTNIVLELAKSGKKVVAVARNLEKARKRFHDKNIILRQAEIPFDSCINQSV